MRTLKLTMAYDGTDFAGWQSQPRGRTVQDVLEAALTKITGETRRVVASGRTDAGVHALGQVVSFCTECALSAELFLRALNSELPRDAVILASEEAPADFHAIRSARRKRYRYQIQDGPLPDVFSRRYAWRIFPSLDEDAMRTAAAALLGEHDFASFQSSGAKRASTIRTVSEISIRRSRAGEGGPELLQLEVEADGFLYHMVRNIVGTLALVGRGKRPAEWLTEVLRALDRRAGGPTAPAQGLFLVKVEY
ncbi:MAG TPA: tRNA pseudouridine(38-40) synthase TruA [Pirellulales bacterium]|jgi:tRNA pseudouridine38-40 synthase|nr:tRNA pseudouridine(38-40) synthase TruA [Pirellulales bacterium]